MKEMKDVRERKASCCCGNLTVTTRAEPLEVSACSCLDCQRASGSTFTYFAIYSKSAVSITGDRKVWRRQSNAGRWTESEFCPICGGTVSFRIEAEPEIILVCAGCFADSDFPKPEKLYWASRHHSWLAFPEGIELIEAEPD